MKILNNLYIVGGTSFGLSHPDSSCNLDCNIYIVDCNNELIMIDAGTGRDFDTVIENIKNDGLNPSKISKILITHSHSDHAGGACEFSKQFNCEVCILDKEAYIIENGVDKDFFLDIAKRTGIYSSDYKFPNCKVSLKLKHGDKIKCGNTTFNVLNIPGHSKESVGYLVEFPEGKAFFSGDIVTGEGVLGVINCEGSEMSDYRKYMPRLSDLDIDMIFPGHGAFVVSGGQLQINKALDDLKKLPMPEFVLKRC